MKKNKLLILTLSTACLIGLASCQGAQGPKGDQGDPGINGTNGTDGKPGEDGKNGNTVLSGKGEPSSTLGSNGDSYIDSSTFDFYVKSNGAWSKEGNLKGNTGDRGNTGDKGDKGEDGSILLKGEGAPSDTLGKNGDSYIDTLTFDFYVKENDTWTKEGNLKGEKGDKGDKGDKGSNGSSGTNGSNGLDGTPAYGNTILSCENGYITVDVGSATVDSYVTFTMHPIDKADTKYIGASLSLINNGTTTTYEPDKADHKLELDDNGLRYVKVQMKEGGFVVKGTFAEKQKYTASVTSNKIVGGSEEVDATECPVTFDKADKTYYEGDEVTITLKGKIVKKADDYKGKYSLNSFKIGDETIDLNDENLTLDQATNVYTYTTKMSNEDLKVEVEWEFDGKSGLSLQLSGTGTGSAYIEYDQKDGEGVKKLTKDFLSGAGTYYWSKKTDFTIYFKNGTNSTLKSITIGNKTINVGEGDLIELENDDNGYEYKYTFTILDELVTIQCNFALNVVTKTLTTIADWNNFISDLRGSSVANYSNTIVKLDGELKTNGINLNGVEWTPITLNSITNFTLDGNGTTIKNFKVSKSGVPGAYAGFFDELSNATIQNLNFDSATIEGNFSSGVIAGQATNVNIIGCNVTNSSVKVVSTVSTIEGRNFISGGYSGGLFAGIYYTNEGNLSIIKDCKVDGTCTVTATNKIGSYIGTVSNSGSFIFTSNYLGGSLGGDITLTFAKISPAESNFYSDNWIGYSYGNTLNKGNNFLNTQAKIVNQNNQ